MNKKGKVTAKKAGKATITVSAAGLKATCKIKVKKPADQDLAGYYRMPYSQIINIFKDGSYVTMYAEYNQYKYRNAVTFFFPKPVAVQSQSPASIITLNGNLAGYTLLGITVGMDRENSFEKLRSAGFSRGAAVGITYYWEDTNGHQVALEADSKVVSIRYGAW